MIAPSSPGSERDTRRRPPYLLRVLLAVDQLGNAVFGGHEDETISSRLGRHKRACGGIIPWRTWFGLARLLDAALERLDQGHALDAIEDRFKR